jgi:hypothetical protein
VPSSNVTYLEKTGPSPPEELPAQLTRNDREHGLALLTLHGGRGKADSLGGRPTRIAYLPSHDCEVVLRAFLDVNPHLPDEKTRRGLTQQFGAHGQQWSRAASTVLDDYYAPQENRGRSTNPGEIDDCPLCTDSISKGTLPDHLATECPQTT